MLTRQDLILLYCLLCVATLVLVSAYDVVVIFAAASEYTYRQCSASSLLVCYYVCGVYVKMVVDEQCLGV